MERLMGSGALFRDGAGRVLLVKPSYKDGWEIPGGAIEPGEPPRACCEREVREELGLDLPVGRLLVVDWVPPEPPRPDGFMFVFDGGVLSGDFAATIRLPPDELVEWRFVEVGELESFVNARKIRRIREAHRCATENISLDLEHGFPPDTEQGRPSG